MILLSGRAFLELRATIFRQRLPTRKRNVMLFLLVGPCSSWLRPHQTRWRVGDLEFAWPSGYGGVGFSRTGLPALDWCCCFQYSDTGVYTMVDVPHRFKNRQILLRIAIPTQTAARRKASINMYWTPGTPRNVRRSVVRFWPCHARMTNGASLAGLSSRGSYGRSQISIATGGRVFLEENLSGSPKTEARAGAVVE